MAKTSPEAQQFISRHVKKHKKMGMKQDQAVAVAYHEAREKGYRTPPPPAFRRFERQK